MKDTVHLAPDCLRNGTRKNEVASRLLLQRASMTELTLWSKVLNTCPQREHVEQQFVELLPVLGEAGFVIDTAPDVLGRWADARNGSGGPIQGCGSFVVGVDVAASNTCC